MSKKTRKNSPKTAVGKPARAKSASMSKDSTKNTSKKSAGASAKTTSAKTTKATAKKSVKGASMKPGNTSAKASHKAPSKPLKPTRRSESVVPVAAASKASAPKPRVGAPPADQAPAPKPVAAAPRPAGLSEGAKAPAFQLPRDGGDSVALSDFKGSKLVLFFYPRADTPGCTREACAFQETRRGFKPHKAAVLGVSILDEASKARFAKKYGLQFPLLADPDHEVAEKYGVWQEKSQYGRTYMGIARTTYLIGPDGKVEKRWDRVKVDGHADEVLAALG